MKQVRRILSLLLVFALTLGTCALTASAKNPGDAASYLISYVLTNGDSSSFGTYSVVGEDTLDFGASGSAMISGPMIMTNTAANAFSVIGNAYWNSVMIDFSKTGAITCCYLSSSSKQEVVSLQPNAIYKNASVHLTSYPGSAAEREEIEYWLTIAFHRALYFLDSQLRLGGYTIADLGFVNYENSVPAPSCPEYNKRCPGARFVDMPGGNNWAHAPIDWAIQENITSGTSLTTFTPNGTCTRAQIVTFLWRAVGCPMPCAMDNPFTDVSEDAYYYDAVIWAVSNHITKGVSDTTFNPNGKCTRAQVVTFQWRLNGQPKLDIQNQFTDVAEDIYYADAVNWAVSRNITDGTGAGKFSPNAACTRAQVVTFLYRAEH